MAHARQLMPSLDSQRTDRAWPTLERRAAMSLLSEQNVVMLGFGAIGHRLAELLAPFRVKITAVRRRPVGDENVAVVTEDKLTEALATADHVVNILPDNPATVGFVNAARLAAMNAGAIFYNVGRGTTVDQDALLAGVAIGATGRGVSGRHRARARCHRSIRYGPRRIATSLRTAPAGTRPSRSGWLSISSIISAGSERAKRCWIG